MTRLQALSDIALALAVTLLGAIVAAGSGFLIIGRLDVPLVLVLPLQGVIVLIGLRTLLRMRGQDWRQLRLLPLEARDVGRGLLSLLLVFLASTALSLAALRLTPGLVERHQARLAELAVALTDDLPLLAIAAVMLVVAFYEEVLARGFLLSRCQTLLGGTWGPVLMSSALFGMGHFYQGWTGVVQTAAIGIVFAHLVLRWGTLWPAILAHTALNTFSLVALRAAG